MKFFNSLRDLLAKGLLVTLPFAIFFSVTLSGLLD